MTNGKGRARRAAAIIFWVLIWQGLSAIIAKPLLLPAPLDVMRALARLAVTAAFWQDTLLTLARVSAGIACALVLGVILAVLCCRFRVVEALFAPIITLIKATPVASFVVLALVWLRRDYVPVLISAMMVLPVIWANVSAGIRQTDQGLLELARAYSLPRGRLLRHIYVPSVLPHFRAACRASLGFGWKAGIAAEVLTVPRHSIGRMIYESKLYLQTTELFAWTLCVIILSLCLEKLVLRLIGGGEKNA